MSTFSLLSAFGVLLVASPLIAQVNERIDVSAIEVPVVVRDAKGSVPANLTASDFVLLEDGKPQQIIGLTYPVQAISPAPVAANPAAPLAKESVPTEKRWQVVIYIQQTLSSTRGLSETLKMLVSHAGELTALGDVQIVGDEGENPHVIASPTHDTDTLRRTLLDLVPTIRGLEEITRLRSQYVSEAGPIIKILPQPQSPSRPAGNSTRALATARLEALIVRARQDAMLRWTARYSEPGRPHALFVVTSGYDLEPRYFYGASDGSTDSELVKLSSASRQVEIAQAMAASGWTILSFAPEWMENASSPIFDVTNSGRGRVNDFKSSGGGTIPTPSGLNVRPLQPLQMMAEETGGSLQTNPSKLSNDLDQLANRLVLTYQLHRPRDGRAHRIEVRSLRAGLSVRAQRVVVSGTPEALSLARATLVASEEGERGELPVRCTVRQLSVSKDGTEMTSQLIGQVGLSPIEAVRAGLTAATLRFSVSVRTKDAPPVTVSKRMENLDLSTKAAWSIDFQLHHRPDAVIGIVAEELATGAWGATKCSDLASSSPSVADGMPTTGVALPLFGRWQKLVDAMSEAQAKGQLILLDLRSSALIDPAGDRWIRDAMAVPAVARAVDQMALGVAGVRSKSNLPDLDHFQGGARHLIVLDPWGGIVLEPEDGFGDFAKFAYALNALRQQAPVFIRAATLRRDGKVAQSLVTWAGGLLDAGATDAAAGAFQLALTVALRDNQPEIAQSAQLGFAAINLQKPQTVLQAMRLLEEIAAHPTTTEITARAWMLIGHVHRLARSTRDAIAAYQKSFAAAPKPSELAEAARRHLETLGAEPESEVQSGLAGNVHLLYPHSEVMLGNVTFGIATSNDAARVNIYLDDARVAELTRRPFRAKVNLGSTPHVHTVRAVAFDAQERKLGEESVALNDRAVSLSVSIVAPASDAVVSRTMVEVRPHVPQGGRLTGVDLYWNETKFATLHEEPFRHELVLPSASASGFIRAVARAADGTTAEDVKMINAGGVAEQLRVDAVRVYAIVQDRAGHYVDGLTASDFRVKEDGRMVTPRLQSAKDDPISIGLALDASSSMQVAMTEVIDYANEFIVHSLGTSDQTFVVAFDEQPRLLQPLTNDRKELTQAIYDMHASGGTAIWDAVLYSLQQFHDVPGKRALVVFTDAVNNAGSGTAKSALQYAREVGVPVYVVQIFTGVHKNLEMTFDENSIQNLTELTGGAFFRFARKRDLPQLFSQIRDDTRGQYLLTYVSPGDRPRGELRRISVEVPGKRVTVRATSGYYPR